MKKLGLLLLILLSGCVEVQRLNVGDCVYIDNDFFKITAKLNNRLYDNIDIKGKHYTLSVVISKIEKIKVTCQSFDRLFREYNNSKGSK